MLRMLGEEIIGLFEAVGAPGLLLSFVVISFLDGLAIPTVPEAWLILIAMSDVGMYFPLWALSLVVVGTSSAVAAQVALFMLVRKSRLPKRIERIMDRYTKFLIVSDERLAFVNWLAPLIPFTGAFVAVCGWRPKLAFAYSILGGLCKMTILVAIAGAFPLIFSPQAAADASLLFVGAILALSLTFNYLRRRRLKIGAMAAEGCDGESG